MLGSIKLPRSIDLIRCTRESTAELSASTGHLRQILVTPLLEKIFGT